MTTRAELPPDVKAAIDATVAAAAWLARRGEVALALAMRDEFMAEWECDAALWNEHVDVLIEYAERKGEGPGDHAGPFRAVRL